MTETTAAWQRYRPGDVVLEFNAPVAAIDRRGNGRLVRSQHLKAGDLFCYLPPLPGQQKESGDQGGQAND